MGYITELFYSIQDKLTHFNSSLPQFITLITEFAWVTLGLGLFIYSKSALERRSRTERNRVAQNKNGLGEIISKSRVSIALDLFQISIAVLIIGTVVLLFPQPATQRGFLLILSINGTFIFLAYKLFHAARTLDKSDVDSGKWLRANPDHNPADEILIDGHDDE